MDAIVIKSIIAYTAFLQYMNFFEATVTNTLITYNMFLTMGLLDTNLRVNDMMTALPDN